MLANMVRRIVPIKARQSVGCWMLNQTGRSMWLLWPYLKVLHGRVPINLSLIPDKKALYHHRGHPVVSPRDGLGSFLEVFEEEVYDRVLKPQLGDIVIDVGAYVGMFTVKASKTVGEKGTVVAIEPAPGNLQFLKENTDGLSNVVTVEKAVSDEIRQQRLYISKASACHSLIYPQEAYYTLKTDTIDNIVRSLQLPRVDYVKIDAEGAELEVLKGAEETLATNNVKLSIASYHTLPNGEPEVPQLVAFLEARGFRIIKEKGLREYVYAEKQTDDSRGS